MLSQFLLLVLVMLAVVICVTYVYKDMDKEDAGTGENGQTAEIASPGETSQILKKQSAWAKMCVSSRQKRRDSCIITSICG
jgi:uncharacterized protein (UPF0333 family)